ncbi:MAG: hypothetical protein A2Y56_13055 [Candidatus Aminicenantes bacterium RBG_13_63_10]|nr:MAG: hypothetical protein A2Y56_13055 [Candidatus Aminicenantes bacterium RBG_13_63_10]
MRIDIDKLPAEGLRIDRDFEFEASDLVEEEAAFLQPAHAEVTVKKIGEEISVKGRLTARLSIPCGRCLTPFEYPVDSAFDMIFLPEELNEVKEELDEEDMDLGSLEDRTVDLEAVILEQLNLTFPAKPLCSKDCEGICPVCGRIRRESGCGCSVREDDTRLSKIKYFIKS